MNNSTIKNVVIVGLLFLSGLVVLSFVNFVNFSPATPKILQATAVADTRINNLKNTKITAQKEACIGGKTDCHLRTPLYTIIIENKTDIYIMPMGRITDTAGKYIHEFSWACTNESKTGLIPPQNTGVFTCIDSYWHWDQKTKDYYQPGGYGLAYENQTLCIYFYTRDHPEIGDFGYTRDVNICASIINVSVP